jgi:hypothetical protein
MPLPSVPADIKSPVVAAEQNGNPIRVWAAGIKTPLRYQDPDGRLNEGERASDQFYGQTGWDVSMEFRDFAHLADLLGGGAFDLPNFVCGNMFFSCGPIVENQIDKLGILAHGAPGAVDVDGAVGTNLDAGATDPTLMNELTLSRYAADFAKIERVLRPRAKVMFMSCLAGKAQVGENFLKAVSLLFAAKDVLVYGFRTVLYQKVDQKKSGSNCFPGARETHYDTISQGQGTKYYETPNAWNDLSALPWASERSAHCVMAYKGSIVIPGAGGNPWGFPTPSP